MAIGSGITGRQCFPAGGPAGGGDAAQIVVGAPGFIFCGHSREDDVGPVGGEAVILWCGEGGGGGVGVAVTGSDVAWFADGEFESVVAGDIDHEQVLSSIFDVAVPVSVEQFAKGACFDG